MKRQLLAVLIGALIGAAPAAAATLIVTNSNDSGPGSLRDAIALASPGDEIQFDPELAGIPIVLASGELLIDKNLTLTGLGRNQTILDGNSSSRIFDIAPSAVVTLSMLTIRDGFPQMIVPGPQGNTVIAEGGGIYNAGTLTLNDSSVENNKASSNLCAPSHCYPSSMTVSGGGIFNSGTLQLNRCTITGNLGDGYISSGGGIYNSGQATLVETEISHNFGYWDRYHGLAGTGLFNSGTMSIIDGRVIDNDCMASQAILNVGTLALTRTALVRNSGWAGGGLSNSGTANILESLIDSNWNGAGGGNAGEAAGITNRGLLTLVRSTVSNNSTDIFGVGGIVNFKGTVRLINSTVAGNSGRWGTGGIKGPALLVSSTVTGNRLTSCWDPDGGGRGGISAESGTTVVSNTIIAGNLCQGGAFDFYPADCYGTVESLGNNLLGDPRYCHGLNAGSPGDIVGVDWATIFERQHYYWGVGPDLEQNGGPTTTVALLPGSPAIDAIPPEACTDDQGNTLTTDQRGVTRPQGAACDIGAFELSWPRGAGFWTHQCSDKGFRQVGSEELQALFAKVADASSVFPECAPIGCAALDPTVPKNDIRARAQQALLDVWLNPVSGRLTRGRPIDLPDLTSAATVGEAIGQLETTVCDPDATRSQLGNAKDLAEALNGSPDDMELAAQEAAVTLLPGASQTVTLGLVNLSAGNRNYSLTVSGPWPVQLSTTRLNALGSGQVAQLTATVTAPRDTQSTAARVQIVATDLLSQGTLSRKVVLTLRLGGTAPSEPALLQRPRVAE